MRFIDPDGKGPLEDWLMSLFTPREISLEKNQNSHSQQQDASTSKSQGSSSTVKSSNPGGEEFLKTFIIPAAKGIEIASEAHDVGTLTTTIIDGSKTMENILKCTESLGYIAPAVTTAKSIMEYKAGDISKNQMVYNVSGAGGIVVATAINPVAGASAGLTVTTINGVAYLGKVSFILGSGTLLLRSDIIPQP